MRKVIVTEFISIDGVIQEPHLWHFPFWSDEMGAYKTRELHETGALLLGRVTYDGFADAWPKYEDDPEINAEGFATRMNTIPKYVVSTTLQDPSWNNSRVISANVADEIRKLKEEDGQDIFVAGSGVLINSLIDDGVIDEYRLMVHPVVVGKGQRLFADRETPAAMDLASTEALPNGVMVMNYVPKPATADPA